jgi:hypothetical protein
LWFPGTAALYFAQDIFDVSNVADLGEFDESDLKVKSGLRCPPEIAFDSQQHVEETDQILFRKGICASGKCTLLFGASNDLFRQPKLDDQQIANPTDKLTNILLKIQTLIDDDGYVFEKTFGIAVGQAVDASIEDVARNETQNIAHVFIDDVLAAERDDLIQKRLRIPHTAFRSFDDIAERAVVDLDAFPAGDLPQVRLNFRG